jgi:hypothetical protein
MAAIRRVPHGARRGSVCNRPRPSDGWIHVWSPRAMMKSWSSGISAGEALLARVATEKPWLFTSSATAHICDECKARSKGRSTRPIRRGRAVRRVSTVRPRESRPGGLPGRPGEFRPEPPTDPDVNLSIHPARATQRRLPPSVKTRSSSGYPLTPSRRG